MKCNMSELRINTHDYFTEALNFLVGKIPVIGDIHGVHGKVLRNAEIDYLKSQVDRIDNLESLIRQLSNDLNNSRSTSFVKSGAIELESTKDAQFFSGTALNDSNSPVATNNQYIKNIRSISPKEDFFFELKMQELTNQFEKKKGISLIFIDPVSNEIIPEFLHLIISHNQAFLTHTNKISSQELGWAEIPVFDINLFKMGRKNGLFSCSINNVNIFTEGIRIENNLQPGIFIEKEVSVRWNLIFTFFNSSHLYN